MENTDTPQIYQIKITLSDTKPLIWRRFLIDPNETLFKLHKTIQIIMGWTNSHMHQYRKNKIYYGKVDKRVEADFGFEVLDEKKFKILQVLDKLKAKLIYEYDMGDSWEHILVLEKILPEDDKIKYPVCLDGAMACPPEDSGGIPGFYNFLEIIGNPDNDEYDEMMKWSGGEFNPDEFNLHAINHSLQRMK
jgi:hypothetical protein